tara:strand:- start:3913 stop:5034 length:1122 start_codon:yes stop_codon:yes gene_type:complete
MNKIINDRFSKNSEKKFQNTVINNTDIQRYIVNNLEIEYSKDIKFTKCGPYFNRIYPDIKITKNEKILALIECKSANINVTDYVRGIGQLFQYEYFFENKYIEKNNNNLTYDSSFRTVYLYPSEVTLNNDFNISKFKYPNTTKILQINLENSVVRDFSEDQKKKFAGISENLIGISEYYFRDNRLFELYILLDHLNKFYVNKKINLNRKQIEEKELRKYNTPNNRNWRNAFITLSGLGLITSKNNISSAGIDIMRKSYFEFCCDFYYAYIKPYAEEILPILNKKPSISPSDLNNIIRRKNENREVLFVTESDNRYLSSWLNIFRDDYGFIDFKSRTNNRKINYLPFKIEKKQLLKNIISFSKAPKITTFRLDN